MAKTDGKTRKIRAIATIVLVALVGTTHAACAARRAEKPDRGIAISFVTGFEDADPPLRIEPIVTYKDAPAKMPPDPFRLGYEFEGWYVDSERTREFDSSAALWGDTKLYAKMSRTGSDATAPRKKEERKEKGLVVVSANGRSAVTGYDGNEEKVRVPEWLDGKRITGIGRNAFRGCVGVREIEIPASIESVEPGAFAGCADLETIRAIGDGKYESRNGALYADGGTTLVAAGPKFGGDAREAFEGAKKLEKECVSGCRFRIELDSPSMANVVGEEAFRGFAGAVAIGEFVREVRRRAFFEATCEIDFSRSTIEKFGSGAFEGYAGDAIEMPKTLKVAECAPFAECRARIEFGEARPEILGEKAFFKYRGEELAIPASVEKIGSGCFAYCAAKVRFERGSKFETIEKGAFSHFRGDAAMPESARKICDDAFFATRGRIAFPKRKEEYEFETSFEAATTLADVDGIAFGQGDAT